MSAVAPVVTVTPSQATVTNVQSLPVDVAVTGTAGTATGAVVLSIGSWTSGSATLNNGVASFIVPPGVLALGAGVLSAAYTPDTPGAVLYTAGTGTADITVIVVPVAFPSKLQGYKGQLGFLNAGVLVIVAGLKEVDGGFKIEQLDATDHGTNGWKDRLSGLNDFEGSAKLDYIEGDASQTLLLNAVLNHTKLSVKLYPVKAAGSGANSFVGQAIITDFKWDGKNTDLQGVALTLAGAGPFSIVGQ